jgi:hypothetical protein
MANENGESGNVSESGVIVMAMAKAGGISIMAKRNSWHQRGMAVSMKGVASARSGISV